MNTTVPQTNIISTIKQLINAVSHFLQLCRNIRIKFLSWAYMYTTLERVIQTNPSKLDEMLFSGIYLCRLLLKQGREMFLGREFQRDAPHTHREREREREREGGEREREL